MTAPIDKDAAISAALSNHWATQIEWGGEARDACGHCAYMDGVRRLWPCPTVVALTGCEPPDPRPSSGGVCDECEQRIVGPPTLPDYPAQDIVGETPDEPVDVERCAHGHAEPHTIYDKSGDYGVPAVRVDCSGPAPVPALPGEREPQ